MASLLNMILTSFINDTLLSDNWDGRPLKALKDWETSFHFYSYLAKNSIVPDDLCSLPFFNDHSEAAVEDDFNDKFIFLPSSEGKEKVQRIVVVFDYVLICFSKLLIRLRLIISKRMQEFWTILMTS